jgi:hypothetical protein
MTCRAATCSAWRCPRWASSGRDRVGVQEGRARCRRSCSAAAAGGSAQEQRDRAWRTSEAVEEKAADEIRRHRELLVEDLKVARCKQTMALAEAEGVSVARRSEGEGPDGFGLARPRVRAGVFYR